MPTNNRRNKKTKTSPEYIDSLRKLNLEIYLLGERVDNPVDHPIIRPSINCVAMTYKLAEDPALADLMTTTSSLTGKRINRFTSLHQGVDDLIRKVKMQRLLGQKTGSCFQRCVGFDAINTVYSVTYELDDKYGTPYHNRFKDWLAYVQQEDLVVAGAMTDPKGDRSLSPIEQTDPDQYLHLVERRDDGVVVRGAKAHQSGMLNSHEMLVMPTRALGKGNEAYALSFAIPTNTQGMVYIYGRQSCDTRKLEGGNIDVGNYHFGSHEVLTIFDNVFVPNERVFMCGENDFAVTLVERFAGYHRQSYGGCKAGVGDVLIGAAATIAEYNGVAKAAHIREKIAEMVHLNETLYSCGIACSAEGFRRAAGNYEMDMQLANVCKHNVTRFPYELTRLAEDIAGGLLVTLPSEKDLHHPKAGKYIDKYLRGVADVPTEHRIRMLRLIENMTFGTSGIVFRTESMHGAGSPQSQKIMILRLTDLDFKKRLARELAGIDDYQPAL